MFSLLRVAPDLVGVMEWVGVGGLVQGAQAFVSVADGANAPSGGGRARPGLRPGGKEE